MRERISPYPASDSKVRVPAHGATSSIRHLLGGWSGPASSFLRDFERRARFFSASTGFFCAVVLRAGSRMSTTTRSFIPCQAMASSPKPRLPPSVRSAALRSLLDNVYSESEHARKATYIGAGRERSGPAAEAGPPRPLLRISLCLGLRGMLAVAEHKLIMVARRAAVCVAVDDRRQERGGHLRARVLEALRRGLRHAGLQAEVTAQARHQACKRPGFWTGHRGCGHLLFP
ncbi:hypothetical protein HU200_024995 [Digitaria exilis]|uniref:Uncharacterized protein n=1 Tax=Digitaria exilis TaxID=1010633 RepID=A0A835ESW4_9POAL|nr:hypothetical protein HU200_024995 [Digitaria exilis]